MLVLRHPTCDVKCFNKLGICNENLKEYVTKTTTFCTLPTCTLSTCVLYSPFHPVQVGKVKLLKFNFQRTISRCSTKLYNKCAKV